ESVRRDIGSGGHFRPACGFLAAISHQATGGGDPPMQEYAPVGDPALGAVVSLLDMRNAVAPATAREAARPEIRWLLEVVVDADQAVFELHGSISNSEPRGSHYGGGPASTQGLTAWRWLSALGYHPVPCPRVS